MRRRRRVRRARSGRSRSCSSAALVVLAVRVLLSRYDALFADHTVFSGVTYTDAHVRAAGPARRGRGAGRWARRSPWRTAFRPRRLAGLVLAVLPALRRLRRRARGRVVRQRLRREAERAGPRDAVHPPQHRVHAPARSISRGSSSAPSRRSRASRRSTWPGNRPTLDNIRLWEWRALQDTLRQIQEIRTYYDFPDIDIDRYRVGGELRQMMVAARELSVDKLPESSRNWINEKLIYTHGYGVTMNPVNGFTPDGLPDARAVRHAGPLDHGRPAGHAARDLLRPAHDHRRLRPDRAEGVQLPAGREQQLHERTRARAASRSASWARRLLIAFNRGDLSKLPFSDDVRAGQPAADAAQHSRPRAATLAPFLVYDHDPYVVVGTDGRLYWIMDAFTTSDTYPLRAALPPRRAAR